jgi:hypothetical protein
MNGKKNLDFVKDVELLRKELQDTYDKFGVSTYSIVDDTFNDNEYKLDLILEAVKQLTFKPIFWAYTRLDLLETKKQIEKLYEIGVRGYYFGIETLNKEEIAQIFTKVRSWPNRPAWTGSETRTPSSTPPVDIQERIISASPDASKKARRVKKVTPE